MNAGNLGPAPFGLPSPSKPMRTAWRLHPRKLGLSGGTRGALLLQGFLVHRQHPRSKAYFTWTAKPQQPAETQQLAPQALPDGDTTSVTRLHKRAMSEVGVGFAYELKQVRV